MARDYFDSIPENDLWLMICGFELYDEVHVPIPDGLDELRAEMNEYYERKYGEESRILQDLGETVCEHLEETGQ